MQTPQPTPEHEWLLQLLGDWTFESECVMGPDQPPMKSTGKQTTRSLGSLWTLGEMENDSPDGQAMRSVFTLGFDPAKRRFVGTFVASCMTHLWPYDGQLDAVHKVLTLDSEGPSFADDGTMAKYQDIITIVDQDQYLLASQYQNPDGSWTQFMSAKYIRVTNPSEPIMSATDNTTQQDEAEIRRLIAAWSAALEAKDLDGLVADYADDAVLFDAIPPYKTVGKEAIRQVWANCLPYFPERFKSEHRDIVIHISGDTAVMHCLHHFIPEQADDPIGQNWLRVTVGYRRIDGKWKSVHDHISTPFNPMNNQAWMIRDPNTVDVPDYGAAGGS